MIEIIEGIAYLKNITSPMQSLDMFAWLRNNPQQKLYLIQGQNKYGCGENGTLVRIDDMPLGSIEIGFCVNPFYIEYKPLENAELRELAPEVAMSNGVDEMGEVLKMYEDCKLELQKCIDEKNLYTRLYDELMVEYEKSSTEMLQLQSKIECLVNERETIIEQLNSVQEKINDVAINENKVDKTDIRGLCKALYDLMLI